MPCSHAMIEDNIITVTTEATIEEVLELFSKHRIRSVPVVDTDMKLLGVFNFRQLLLTILPIPDDVGHHLHALEVSLDHLFGQSEWLAERLHKRLHKKIGDIMVQNPKVVHPDTPIGEGTRILACYGSPVIVTEDKTDKVVGLITSQSVIKILLKLKEDSKDSLV